MEVACVASLMEVQGLAGHHLHLVGHGARIVVDVDLRYGNPGDVAHVHHRRYHLAVVAVEESAHPRPYWLVQQVGALWLIT